MGEKSVERLRARLGVLRSKWQIKDFRFTERSFQLGSPTTSVPFFRMDRRDVKKSGRAYFTCSVPKCKARCVHKYKSN